MRATVFTDPAITEHAGRFVWLSINAEEAANAPFLSMNKIVGFPTFLVIDPATEKVAKQWLGGFTLGQFEEFLDDGERAVAAIHIDDETDPFARAERLAAQGQWADAIGPYSEALATASANGPERGRIVEGLVMASMLGDDVETCATVAAEEAPALPRGPRFLTVAVSGLDCALATPDDVPWKGQVTEALYTMAEESVGLENALADDRSSAYGTLVGYYKVMDDEVGAREMTERWLSFLEGEAAKAENPEARAVFDSHRVSAALELGQPERVIPALQQSEQDLPDDYNPPARLALLYREAGQMEEALAASERALAKAYGPRKLRIYLLQADILDRSGDADGAVGTLDEALVYSQTLPEVQRPQSLVKRIEDQRNKLAG